MILVTVGTHPQSFNRLLKTIDKLVEKKVIKEEVVMQIGHSIYEPKNARWFRFTNYKKIEKLNKNARLVITHGGAGSILKALSYGTPVIAVPRLKKFGEHINDHQVDLVKKLSYDNKITAVFNLAELGDKISKIFPTKKSIKNKNLLIKEIKNYLNSL